MKDSKIKHQLRSLDPFLSFAYSEGDLPKTELETEIPGFMVLGKKNEDYSKFI